MLLNILNMFPNRQILYNLTLHIPPLCVAYQVFAGFSTYGVRTSIQRLRLRRCSCLVPCRKGPNLHSTFSFSSSCTPFVYLSSLRTDIVTSNRRFFSLSLSLYTKSTPGPTPQPQQCRLLLKYKKSAPTRMSGSTLSRSRLNISC